MGSRQNPLSELDRWVCPLTAFLSPRSEFAPSTRGHLPLQILVPLQLRQHIEFTVVVNEVHLKAVSFDPPGDRQGHEGGILSEKARAFGTGSSVVLHDRIRIAVLSFKPPTAVEGLTNQIVLRLASVCEWQADSSMTLRLCIPSAEPPS